MSQENYDIFHFQLPFVGWVGGALVEPICDLERRLFGMGGARKTRLLQVMTIDDPQVVL